MKQFRFVFLVFLGLALAVAGCAKKSADQASLTGTGFETLDKTEELAQLPQANTANQQAAIEILPIETSPVTQTVATTPAVPMPPTVDTPIFTTTPTSTDTLSYNQKIQTALKSAGLYQGAIDGKIGPATRQAIQTFQQNNGLKVDGKVGPRTWAVLERYLNSETTTDTSEN